MLKTLKFFHKFRFQTHRTKTINFAINIMIATFNEANILYLGPFL